MQHTNVKHCQSGDAKNPENHVPNPPLLKRTKHQLTQVFNLYLQLPKKASNVAHHAVVLGGERTKSSLTYSNIFKSTASEGPVGEHGNNPCDSKCNGAEQEQTWSNLIPAVNQKRISLKAIIQTFEINTGNTDPLDM
jgi:hypothetical protein